MNNTKDLARKKIIGTAIFALFVFGLALSASSSVQALFISTKGTINVDGTVTDVGISSLTISTNDSIITFNTDGANIIPNGTTFIGGERVRVKASPNGGIPLAIVIKKLNSSDPGYGTQGDNVNINDAIVYSVDIDNKTFTVNTGYTLITFRVSLSDTKFNGNAKNLSELSDLLGQGGEVTIHVNGEDSASGFLARTVITKKK
ncbi:MAG: hypothetical protein KAI71_05885 [Candidatus Pacebacteria bacterium]|nr:hypothetical protein [Candidatus Paceibacterota bacterium]